MYCTVIGEMDMITLYLLDRSEGPLDQVIVWVVQGGAV